jgi:hypothetical protein
MKRRVFIQSKSPESATPGYASSGISQHTRHAAQGYEGISSPRLRTPKFRKGVRHSLEELIAATKHDLDLLGARLVTDLTTERRQKLNKDFAIKAVFLDRLRKEFSQTNGV